MNPIYKFELNRSTVNLLNPKTVKTGLLSTSNGSLDSSSTLYQSTDFIPVTPGTNYKLCDKDTFISWAASAACFYTENKVFISGQYGIGETPANAAFLRVSYYNLSSGNYGVFPSTTSSYSAYVSPLAYPIYKDDLAKDFEKESGQEFFRAKLSGNLTFESADYDFIVAQVFDFQFVLTIFISYNAGQTWAEYWRGTFWKTDCEFNADEKTVKVKPTVWDQYNDVLAGLEKEYNLIDLAPVIVPVQLDKRPCIQIVEPNSGVIGFAMSGNGLYWESECEPSSDAELVNANFGVVSSWYPIQLTWSGGDVELLFSTVLIIENTVINYGKYTLQITQVAVPGGGVAYDKLLTRNEDGAKWSESGGAVYAIGHLEPVPDTPATGTVDYTTLSESTIYGRIITDVVTAWPLQNDIVYNNRNYHYCEPCANNNDLIQLSGNFSTTPTKYGIKQPGIYYDVPDTTHHWEPVARNMWGDYSVWINVDELMSLDLDSDYSVETTLNNAYPLSSVISVLLAQVAPNLTHLETTDYSQFLYGTNPLLGINQRVFITPKSNMVTLGYDQPAQKAPITLKRVLDMLRDCFRCYWFVDDQNRFRIEHISYFMNGGAYPETPDFPKIGIDLTQQVVTRNGKPWAYARNQYQFDKPEMAARYQFGWMDDVTQLFEGNPLEIVSKYVNPENIEQIDISQFTSDVDYILLNPGEISKDGFVLLATGAISQIGQLGYAQGDLSNYYLDPYQPITASNRIYSPLFQISEGVTQIQIDSYNAPGYGYDIVLYNANQRLIARSSYTGNATIQVSVYGLTAKYMAVVLRKTDNSNIVPNEAANVHANIFGMVQSEKLPYYEFIVDGVSHILQNAYVAFIFLQQYYFWDMPALYFKYNGEQMVAQGVKKLKTQTLKFPAFTDPDLTKLIKTELGNGVIQKMSVNLSSRNANTTLKYDTE